MNLDAYQFVACQRDKKSPVILSEFAGAAHCLSGVLMVNPYDEAKVAKAIKQALEMNDEKKEELYEQNYRYMSAHGSKGWLLACSAEMNKIAEKNLSNEEVLRVKKLSVPYLMECYARSNQRLFFFDYDGTLAALEKLPHLAKPTREIFQVLQDLSRDSRNIIYLITGRDRSTIEDWLGHLPIGFSCEHGAFFCESNLKSRLNVEPGKQEKLVWKNTTSNLNLDWKEQVLKIIENFADRTPGSLVEVKEIGLTWHYRNADPDFAEYQKNELVHQ
jgi:trehalose 6-phosphate synthase/phosphatase